MSEIKPRNLGNITFSDFEMGTYIVNSRLIPEQGFASQTGRVLARIAILYHYQNVGRQTMELDLTQESLTEFIGYLQSVLDNLKKDQSIVNNKEVTE